MTNIRFLQGLKAKLPSNGANESDLLFTTDSGELFKGAGQGNPLIKYSSVLTGFTDLKDLETQNPAIEDKIYILNNNDIYCYRSGFYIQLLDASKVLVLQDKVNTIESNIATLTAGVSFKGKVSTYAALATISTPNSGSLVVVLEDENNENGRTMYIYSEDTSTWDFVGQFEFSDSFVGLTDTPPTLLHTQGKILKSDEENGKLIFDDVAWSDVKNKPLSPIEDIDEAVTNRHIHNNSQILAELSEDNNGNLLYKSLSVSHVKWNSFEI